MTHRYHHKHQTHRETLFRFIGLLGLLIAYFVYLSWKYDVATGGYLSALTWSFFVLCTPIADGGFLIDFPVRLLLRVRMIYSELCVWATAITLNILTLVYDPGIYDKTFLTVLLKKVLETPWPYWGIIALSAAGTYLSLFFGDEMLDVFKHSDRKKFHKHGFKWTIVATVTLFLLAVVAYYELIKSLGIDIEKVV